MRVNMQRPLRVVHCPVNMGSIGWTNVQFLRTKGVDARLVLFKPRRLRPYEVDVVLDVPDDFWRRQLAQFRALDDLLPTTDIFHFYFGLTLVPKKLQFPILEMYGKKSVFHYLGSDIRGKTPKELAYGKRASAEIVGSYDAIRWVPEAHVVPNGLDLGKYAPVPPPRNKPDPRRPRTDQPAAEGDGMDHRRVPRAPCRARHRREHAPRRGGRALQAGGHRRRPAERRLVRRVRARVHGARQAGAHLPPRRGGHADGGSVPRASFRSSRRRRRRSSEDLRPLVESAGASREEIGAAQPRIRRARPRRERDRGPADRDLREPVTWPRCRTCSSRSSRTCRSRSSARFGATFRRATTTTSTPTWHRRTIGYVEEWEQHGQAQFDYLTGNGLEPHHYFLDIGCGPLRGGVHFIRYLEPGHYYGVEKNADVLETAREVELPKYGLLEQQPTLRADETLRLPGARAGSSTSRGRNPCSRTCPSTASSAA